MKLLEEKGIEFEIVYYIKNCLNKNQLKSLSKKLNLSPGKFVRIRDIKKLNLIINLKNENDVIDNMIKYPKIIERPIIVKGKKAIIGRPPENLLKLFN